MISKSHNHHQRLGVKCWRGWLVCRLLLAWIGFALAFIYIGSSSHQCWPFSGDTTYFIGHTEHRIKPELKMGTGWKVPFLVKPFLLQDIVDLLREFDAAAAATGVRYAADESTLLGAMRHDGQMPWDDDSDVTVLAADEQVFLGPMRVALNMKGLDIYQYPFGYKVTRGAWDVDGRSVHPRRPSFPFIDVFLGEVRASDGAFLRIYKNSDNRYKYPHDNFPNPSLPKDDWLPFQRVPFGGLPNGISAPANPDAVLRSIYGSTWAEWGIGRGPKLVISNHWANAVKEFIRGDYLTPLAPTPPGGNITVPRVSVKPTVGIATVLWGVCRMLPHMFQNTDLRNGSAALFLWAVGTFVGFKYIRPCKCLGVASHNGLFTVYAYPATNDPATSPHVSDRVGGSDTGDDTVTVSGKTGDVPGLQLRANAVHRATGGDVETGRRRNLKQN